MILTQTVAPVNEPLSTDEAKDHLRVDAADEDTYIDNLIQAAREYVEVFTRRQLITATYALRLDDFPSIIALPRPPLLSVTSITYVDTAGSTQTLGSSVYDVDIYSEPGRVYEAYGQTWPAVRSHKLDVVVTFTAGYGATSASVPGPIRSAMLLLIADLYEHREAQSELRIQPNPAADRLLWAYRHLEL